MLVALIVFFFGCAAFCAGFLLGVRDRAWYSRMREGHYPEGEL